MKGSEIGRTLCEKRLKDVKRKKLSQKSAKVVISCLVIIDR